MIQFNQVSKYYPNGFEALHNINLTIGSGEFVFVTGHSGAGKTTLLKLIMLIERATKGQIIINGKNLSRLRHSQIPPHRRNIGIIFQNPQLLSERTVFDNVALPLVISGFPTQDTQRRVRAALDKVGLLSKARLLPHELSAGEQQRVGIARAVVNKPPVLLADEPTGNLDPTLAAEIMSLFEQFNQVGVSVVIASHDLPLIKRLRHRIITIEHGRLIQRDYQYA